MNTHSNGITQDFFRGLGVLVMFLLGAFFSTAFSLFLVPVIIYMMLKMIVVTILYLIPKEEVFDRPKWWRLDNVLSQKESIWSALGLDMAAVQIDRGFTPFNAGGSIAMIAYPLVFPAYVQFVYSGITNFLSYYA